MDIRTPRRRCAGLTLIELLATLAAAVVMLALGVPGYRALTDTQRIHASANAIVANLQLARSEAVKRGQRVALCPSPDGIACAAGFDWSAGWLVFVDLNQDRERQPQEPLLRVGDAGAPLQILTSSSRRRLIYEPDGSVLGGSNTSFRICSPTVAERNRAVIVSMTGRPRVSERDAANQAVACS